MSTLKRQLMRVYRFVLTQNTHNKLNMLLEIEGETSITCDCHV